MKINVQHVARLANLTIKAEEVSKFESQLSEVLDYVNKLTNLDTKNIKETSQVTGLENVTREDVSASSLTQTEALSNGKKVKNGAFRVKGIFEDE